MTGVIGAIDGTYIKVMAPKGQKLPKQIASAFNR